MGSFLDRHSWWPRGAAASRGLAVARPATRRCGALLVVSLGLAAGIAESAPPLDPPLRYSARGTATATVVGPNCCNGTVFSGRFRLAYEVSSSGEAWLGELTFELDDRDVFVHGGFLGLFTEVIPIRCGGGGSRAPASGWADGPELLRFPAGALQIAGGFADERLTDGVCGDIGTSLAAVNSSDVAVTHRPAGDQVALDATFSAELGGGSYVLHLQGSGRFDNRPPLAELAFGYPDGTYQDGGCPAFWWQNEQKQWELAAQANAPEGLVASLLSLTSDLDGGRRDIFGDRWFDTRPGERAAVLGQGGEIGPFTFGWGAPHQVELLSFDGKGASAAAACSFRVVDTVPPLVTPPAPLVTSCSTAGGATPATSSALAAFLAGARASDVADTTPTQLPPLLTSAGTPITSTTLFPADGASRSVTFRFRDDWSNAATATATVRVVDSVAPALSLRPSPSSLSPDYAFHTIVVTPTMSDNCGGTVSLRLVSIYSNAPAYDAADIVGASYGTDDRSFSLRARPAAPGVKRSYTITYRASDAAGNVRLTLTTVTVNY